MSKSQEIIQYLIDQGCIPSSGKFEITDNLIKLYYSTYSRVFAGTSGPGKKSNIKYARRLAGLNLLKENLQRGVRSSEIKAGHVYLIGNPAFPTHYKIGVSFDALKRLSQYQTYSPFRDFYLEKYDFVVDKYKVEKMLLAHPLITKEQGEWVLRDKAVQVYDVLSTYNNQLLK